MNLLKKEADLIRHNNRREAWLWQGFLLVERALRACNSYCRFMQKMGNEYPAKKNLRRMEKYDNLVELHFSIRYYWKRTLLSVITNNTLILRGVFLCHKIICFPEICLRMLFLRSSWRFLWFMR